MSSPAEDAILCIYMMLLSAVLVLLYGPNDESEYEHR